MSKVGGSFHFPKTLLIAFTFFAIAGWGCEGNQGPPPGELGGLDTKTPVDLTNITEPEVAADPCSNGIKDAGESDVDCGGNCSTKCAPFKSCETDADCMDTYSDGNNTYTNIRCDETVASFDPAEPVDLEKRMCVNEKLVWDSIQVAVALGAGGKSGGTTATGTGSGSGWNTGSGGSGFTGGTGGSGTSGWNAGTGGPGYTGGTGGSGGAGGAGGSGGAVGSGGSGGATGSGANVGAGPGFVSGSGTGSGSGSGGPSGATGASGTTSGSGASGGPGDTAGGGGTGDSGGAGGTNDPGATAGAGDPGSTTDPGGGGAPADSGTGGAAGTDVSRDPGSGSGTTGTAQPFEACSAPEDCAETATVNNKTYSGITCRDVYGDMVCANQELLGDLANAIRVFQDTKPKRHTPAECTLTQYLFVSDKDGADNVYAVPCEEDGYAHPAVPLTQNTDPDLKIQDISVRSDGTHVLYQVKRPVGPTHFLLDPDNPILQQEFDILLPGGYQYHAPNWSHGDLSEINYIRYDPSGKHEITWSGPKETGYGSKANPYRLETASFTEIDSLAIYPESDPNGPNFRRYIFTQKDPNSDSFYLTTQKSGEGTRFIKIRGGGEFESWDKLSGKNVSISPDGNFLVYENTSNGISICEVNWEPYTHNGSTFFRCTPKTGIRGNAALGINSPCFSGNGKQIYYQFNYLGVDFIGRLDRDTGERVILDEFTGENAASERVPGCFPASGTT